MTASHPHDVIGVLRAPDAVHFGRGALASLAPAVARLGRRALVVVDPFLAGTPEFAEALAALDAAVAGFAAMGHGIEQTALVPDPGYAPAFRSLWQLSAARIPADTPEQEALLEPLTRWLLHRGRELTGRQVAEALSTLAAYERSFIRQLARFDAVLTPALALTPRPVGWYDAVDGERNFAQQVQYTPFTSMVNVTGLPAITLPVAQTAAGLPMGVQLIGRPGGEATLLALGAQLERKLRWQDRVPPGL